VAEARRSVALSFDEFQTNAARRIPLFVLTRDERRRAEEIPVPALP
jgi:hypothetical protein